MEQTMTISQKYLLAINILGGVLVLGSYAYGLITHPGQGMALWGHLPKSAQPIYTVSMFAAAAGYLMFFFHLVFLANPASIRLPWSLPFGTLHILFLLILIPSALWMSLTFAYIANPSVWIWATVRLVLATVGLSSLLLLILLAGLKISAPDQFWWPSVIGAALFAFHTLILDATIWPIYFR
jgi:hypothetical protein